MEVVDLQIDEATRESADALRNCESLGVLDVIDNLRVALERRRRSLLDTIDAGMEPDSMPEFEYLLQEEVEWRQYHTSKRRKMIQTNVNLAAVSGGLTILLRSIAAFETVVISSVISLFSQVVRFGYNKTYQDIQSTLLPHQQKIRSLLLRSFSETDRNLLTFRAKILEKFDGDFLQELQSAPTASKNQQSVAEPAHGD